MASLSVEPGTEEDSIVVSLFDIDAGDVPAFVAREEEYRFMAVKPDELDGTAGEHHHVMCLASCDEDFIKNYGQEVSPSEDHSTSHHPMHSPSVRLPSAFGSHD